MSATATATPARRVQKFRRGALSNFALCRIVMAHPFTGALHEYPTVEHRFQAMKALTAADHDYVAAQPTAADARFAGGPAHRIPRNRSDLRSITCRPDWDDIRDAVMWQALNVKFALPEFRLALLKTDDTDLAEDAPWDNYWGLGADGTGQNRLGQMLTTLRDAMIPRGGRVYAGIGARRTPLEVLQTMAQLAATLARQGWRLRTGMADGADQAFYRGRADAAGPCELYLPNRDFNAPARLPDGPEVFCLEEPLTRAYEIAAEHHPAWIGLAGPVRALMARNVHQILGCHLNDPVAFVCCWTPDGSLDGADRAAGGTGMALRVARSHGIPVRNLARPDHLAAARALLATAT